jgi:hypothetical protein
MFYGWQKGDLFVYSPAAMSDAEFTVVSVDSCPTPTIIAHAGPSTRKRVLRVFYCPDLERAHAGRLLSSYPAVSAWCERTGYHQDLEEIEPITVTAYIEA